VLTITPSPQRRDHLRAIAASLATPNAYYFASERDYTPTNPATILSPIWYTGTDLQPRPLLQNA
jgi:hypothetical protein